MIKNALLILPMVWVSHQALACNDPTSLSNIEQMETARLTQHLPTLRHGIEDKTISIRVTGAPAAGEDCHATFELTVPQSDINEAHDYLDANPAKKILLAAQGYSTLDTTVISAPYNYQLIGNEVKPKHAANIDLKRIVDSVEYTYQLLAQLRINVKPEDKNAIAWPEDAIKGEFVACMNKPSSSDALCNCRVEKLGNVLSPRQFELVKFIQTQPYSVATGAMNPYLQVSRLINQSCAR